MACPGDERSGPDHGPWADPWSGKTATPPRIEALSSTTMPETLQSSSASGTPPAAGRGDRSLRTRAPEPMKTQSPARPASKMFGVLELAALADLHVEPDVQRAAEPCVLSDHGAAGSFVRCQIEAPFPIRAASSASTR